MALNQSQDDEEDFFAMLGEDPILAPSLKTLTGFESTVSDNITSPQLTIPSPERRVVLQSESDSVYAKHRPDACNTSQAVPIHHILSSESDNEIPLSTEPSELPNRRFEDTLRTFYLQYNFGNLDKVPYLAEKFDSRRWELWEQLSIKYRLSPRESRSLWIDFNIHHDGIYECARKLFSTEELILVQGDSIEQRRIAWKKMLNIESDDSKKSLYNKYRTEIHSTEVGDDGINDITRDVHRTHQELGLFQDVCFFF
jgi:hypothetical protein